MFVGWFVLFLLLFALIFFLIFFWGTTEAERGRLWGDWEVSRIEVYDVKLPKNQ